MTGEPRMSSSAIRDVFDQFKIVDAETKTEVIPNTMAFRALQELNLDPSTTDVAKSLPRGRSECMTFEQFVGLYARFAHCEHRVEKVIDDFLALDSNHDGVVDREELHAKLSVVANGERLSETEFDGFFGELDTNGNGEISVIEFAHAMCPDVPLEQLVALIRAYKGLENCPALRRFIEGKSFEDDVRRIAERRSASKSPQVDTHVEEARRKLDAEIQRARANETTGAVSASGAVAQPQEQAPAQPPKKKEEKVRSGCC